MSTAEISWWRTSFGTDEIRRVAESISQEHISMGPVTAEFEQLIADALEVPFVVATTSGSMAILMALLAAGIGPGDEVIVPNRTWIATAHAPMLLGAKVVLVDVEANRPVMDVTQIEQRVTSRTRAILPVHLNGRSVTMSEVHRIATKHGLTVIEDAAQAFCSRNASGWLGCQSFAGCFSLSAAKIISTGQGGFLVTRDPETYRRLKMMRTHGVSDVINASYTTFGFNFRFTDVQAAIGIGQVRRLPEKINHVKAVYQKYAEKLQEFSFLRLIPVNLDAGEIPIYIEVLCQDRDKLFCFLKKHGIQTRPFYPDLNQAEHLKSECVFPNARPFGMQGLFLPSGPDQPHENIDRVIEALRLYRRL